MARSPWVPLTGISKEVLAGHFKLTTNILRPLRGTGTSARKYFISLYQCFMLITIITGGKFSFDPFKILLIIIIKVNIILNIH